MSFPADQVNHCCSRARLLARDPDSLDRVATAFLTGPEFTLTPELCRMFTVWLDTQWRELLDSNVHPVFVDREVTLDEVFTAAANRQPVNETTGERIHGVSFPVSTLHNSPVAGLLTLESNLRLRAVHDLLHLRLGAAADWEGELAVTFGHIVTAPCQLWPILASEVAGQAAVALTRGSFPDQRLSASVLAELIPDPLHR